MLKHRVITAMFLLIFAIIWLFFTNGIIYSGITLFVALVGFYELINMYKFNKLQKISSVLILLAIALSLYSTNYDTSRYIRMITAAFWCVFVPLILATQPKKFSKIVIVIFGIIIFILAFYALVVLKASLGSWQLLSIMAIAWIADTGAYFVGRAIGSHKLAPSISPGKSIEGAIGGLVFVLLYLFILKDFSRITYLRGGADVLRFGLLITIVSIMGDLFESWLKRVSNVKDSGNILPGHGGVFDRIDSLVAVLAVSYAMLYNLL